jgi:hypothetical protein
VGTIAATTTIWIVSSTVCLSPSSAGRSINASLLFWTRS